LKFVRNRLPASVSVAIQPVSVVSLITNGDNSTGVSFASEDELEVAAGGGTVCAMATEATSSDVARIWMHETRSDALMGEGDTERGSACR
jgi:hypothetical protein